MSLSLRSGIRAVEEFNKPRPRPFWLIIPRDRYAEWLDPDLADKTDIQHLLDSLPEPTLTPRIVSPRVNSVRTTAPS